MIHDIIALIITHITIKTNGIAKEFRILSKT